MSDVTATAINPHSTDPTALLELRVMDAADRRILIERYAQGHTVVMDALAAATDEELDAFVADVMRELAPS